MGDEVALLAAATAAAADPLDTGVCLALWVRMWRSRMAVLVARTSQRSVAQLLAALTVSIVELFEEEPPPLLLPWPTMVWYPRSPAVADLRSFPAISCCLSLLWDGLESTIGERRPNLWSATSTFLSNFEAGLEAAGFVVAESGEEFRCPPSESVSPADPDDAEEEDSRLPAPPLALSAMSGREKKRAENYYPLSRSGLHSHNMHLAVNLACVAIREEEELTLHQVCCNDCANWDAPYGLFQLRASPSSFWADH